MWCLSLQHLEEALFQMRKRIQSDPGNYSDVVVLDWIFYTKFGLGCVELYGSAAHADRFF